MKKVVLVLFVTLLLCSCGNSNEDKKLVCKGPLKSCIYKAVEGSTIGEEEYICGDSYGEIEVVFNYKDDDKWDSAISTTTYYEESSSEEEYNRLLMECGSNCVVSMTSKGIVYEETYKSGEYQNGEMDVVKKYMNNMGFVCEE